MLREFGPGGQQGIILWVTLWRTLIETPLHCPFTDLISEGHSWFFLKAWCAEFPHNQHWLTHAVEGKKSTLYLFLSFCRHPLPFYLTVLLLFCKNISWCRTWTDGAGRQLCPTLMKRWKKRLTEPTCKLQKWGCFLKPKHSSALNTNQVYLCEYLKPKIINKCDFICLTCNYTCACAQYSLSIIADK